MLLLKLDIARGYLAVALPAGTFGLVLSRSLWRGRVGRKRADGDFQTAVLVIGERDAVEELATELTRNPGDGYQVAGVAIPGYGPPRGEQITANGRTIPIVGGESHAPEESVPVVLTLSRSQARNISAFEESDDSCGIASRWVLILSFRPE